ncbi:MAG: hypothetical protein VB104_06915 [Candidatus Limiplasma sp.]|nr:hypothetical protein [Candidatus Limiplasma sp.]
MPLLNYTTKVDVYETLGSIQKNLVCHGAKKILTDYDGHGRIMALSFMVEVSGRLIPIQLPANVDRVLAVLNRQKVKCDREQAERVAWRIIKDWVEAQMAILETEMVTMDEIFLPYVVQNGKTLYQAFQENQYKLTDGQSERR